MGRSTSIALVSVPNLGARSGLPLEVLARCLLQQVAPRGTRRIVQRIWPNGARWIALVEGHPEPLRLLSGEQPLTDLRRELAGREGLFVFCRGEELRKVHRSLASIGDEVRGAERYVVLLPARTESYPEMRGGPPVQAFASDVESARQILGTVEEQPKELPYYAGCWAMDTDSVFRLLVRQIPLRAPLAAVDLPADARVRVVVPHRGDLGYLRACLRRLSRAVRGVRSRVHVALDQELGPDALALVKEFPEVAFWRVRPPRSGPYVSRHVLGTTAEEEIVALQDSDDVSCEDRLLRQAEMIQRGGFDVVGCHVLEVNGETKRIRTLRLPADANAPLTREPQYTLFHPAIMVLRSSLVRAGGFSTVRRFASDREFNLRAHLRSLRLGNVEEFLYLRRLRPDSLTGSQETGMDSRVRRELRDGWHGDFERVRTGGLALEASSLSPSHLDPLPELVPVDHDLSAEAGPRARRD